MNPILFFLLIFYTLNSCSTQTLRGESCDSPIYCHGALLHTVQMARIFNDSKYFVDMSLINPVNVTFSNFNKMMSKTDKKPTRKDIQEFVLHNFQTVGELETFHPEDFKYEPNLVKEISDASVRNFAKHLIAIWPSLGRRITHHVLSHPDKFSIIPVTQGFIVPGGRFKEFYYWDSYWIIKGLLLSDMTNTARGMIENMLSMVDRFGFIPNGGRIYYLNRSQPPLLIFMVHDYIKFTNDYQFLRDQIKLLDKEMAFWLNNRMVKINKNGTEYRLAHFDSESDTPRPESYAEDIHTCSSFKTETEQHDCYRNLKCGAESGWDYTTRWFFDAEGGLNNVSLLNIECRRNVPVDLNAIICKCFQQLHTFHLILRETEEAAYWLELALEFQNNIELFLYNEEDGTWYDYDHKLRKQRKDFYPSNLTPLWTESYNDSLKQERGKRSVEYLKRLDIMNFQGGIPTSLKNSGEQWDYPNAWSPLQGIVIFGLAFTGNKEAIAVAEALAKTWVRTNIKAFAENKVMFEKYSAASSGQFGGGGEYHIQSGFGWSNGLILELINYYYRTKTRKYKDFT